MTKEELRERLHAFLQSLGTAEQICKIAPPGLPGNAWSCPIARMIHREFAHQIPDLFVSVSADVITARVAGPERSATERFEVSLESPAEVIRFVAAFDAHQYLGLITE